MNEVINTEKEGLRAAYCLDMNVPVLNSSTIDRPHVIETLHEVTSLCDVVFLEGEEGSGASTLLAQFCETYSDRVFALFVRPYSKFAYSSDYLRSILAEQFHFYVHGTALGSDHVDLAEYQRLLLKVRRKKRNHIYFVVDGLHQIPVDDKLGLEAVFKEVLPLGQEGFKFIITGKSGRFEDVVSVKSARPHQVQRFSPEESHSILANLGIDNLRCQELERLCKGMPGRLSSIRRLVESGVTPELILESDPDQYLKFIELEFRSLTKLTEHQQELLSVFAFSRQPMRASDALEVCAAATHLDLNAIQECCSFIRSAPDGGFVDFVSEPHRRYAQRVLEKRRNAAIEMQIEHLRKDPSGAAAIRFLPAYYQAINRQDVIIELLSPAHYEVLFETTQTLSSLKSRAGLGLSSAYELKKITHLFQFALQRSIFESASCVGGQRSEVAALVALGEQQRALDVAESELGRENRLLLLAEYCRGVREAGGVLDAYLVEHVRTLAASVELSSFGEQTHNLAQNLLFVDPDLAFSVVEAQARGSSAEKDETLAMMAVGTLNSSVSDRASLREKTKGRIASANLKSLVSSLGSVVDGTSMLELRETVSRLRPGRKVGFLKHVVAANSGKPGIVDVVEYALDEAVSDSTYRPSASDLAVFAKPLAAHGDTVTLSTLIGRIDGQLELIRSTSLSRDLVRLGFMLASAQARIDLRLATERVAALVELIRASSSAQVRAQCRSIFIECAFEIRGSTLKAGIEGCVEQVKVGLLADISEILDGSASHYEALEDCLAAVSRADPEMALDVAQRMNTERNRDKAAGLVARSLVLTDHSDKSECVFRKALGLIVDEDRRDLYISQMMDSVEGGGDIDLKWLDSICWALGLARDSVYGASGCLAALRISASANNNVVRERLEAMMDGFIARVDPAIDRARIQFDASAIFARTDLDRSIKLYESAVESRSEARFGSQDSLNILRVCLALLLRTYRSLIAGGVVDDDLLARLYRLIDVLPCALSRASHYCDLAVRAFCEGKSDLCRAIVSAKCIPLMEAVRSDAHLGKRVAVYLFPAIYFGHRSSSFSYVERCSSSERAYLFQSVAQTLVRKVSPDEPWSGEDSRLTISYEEVTDLLELLERAPDDSSFFVILSLLSKAISSKGSKTRITGPQRERARQKLFHLIATKLPDKRNIVHEGYVVAASARTYSIGDSSQADWDNLLIKARAIANAADRQLVLLEVAECIPARFSALQRSVLAEAYALVPMIPASQDRVGRLESYVRAAKDIDVGAAKRALREALNMTFDLDDSDLGEECRRSLIDLSEIIEPGFAEKLADVADSDEARIRAKDEIANAVSVQRYKRQISNPKGKVDEAAFAKNNLPPAAWKAIGALVAKRHEPCQPEHLADFLRASGKFELEAAFPVLSWYIENASRRFTSAGDVRERMLPLAEVILLTSELAVSVLSASGSRAATSSFRVRQLSATAAGLVLGPNSREKAISYIRDWLCQQTPNEILYCDPYFSAADVEFLRLVLSEAPDAIVRVLTSKKALSKGNSVGPDIFLKEWRLLSDQDPPNTEVIAINDFGDDRSPVHDRWLIAGSSGLRLGTSFGSLGVDRVSEISVLDQGRVAEISDALNVFVRKVRTVGGKRIAYASYFL